MPARKIRRAAAHQARKQARKDARLPNQPEVIPNPEPVEVPAEPIGEHTTSQAQIEANRANAQLSTGPTSDAGKIISSQNRRYHGLAGEFQLMPWEDMQAFVTLRNDLRTHYLPMDIVEQSYVDRLAEHTWLRKRCLDLQASCFDLEGDSRYIEDEKQFALLARYQKENECGIDKCVNQLLKLRAAHQKEQNGFESEIRKTEAHAARLRLSEARVKRIEINFSTIPGHTRIPFEELAGAFRGAIREVSEEITKNRAAA